MQQPTTVNMEQQSAQQQQTNPINMQQYIENRAAHGHSNIQRLQTTRHF